MDQYNDTYKIIRHLFNCDPKGNQMVQFFTIDKDGIEHIYLVESIFVESADGVEGSWTSVKLKEIF